jgi:predicted phosphodiesterase
MRIQLASDLHLEMHRDRGASFITSFGSPRADVLVLAGDITSAKTHDQLE